MCWKACYFRFSYFTYAKKQLLHNGYIIHDLELLILGYVAITYSFALKVFV